MSLVHHLLLFEVNYLATMLIQLRRHLYFLRFLLSLPSTHSFAVRTDGGCDIILRPVANGGDKENFRIARMAIVFGDDYPSAEPASVTLTNVKGLKSEDITTLKSIADVAVKELVGQSMIYDLSEKIKEWLLANNIKESESLHDKIREQMDREEALKRERMAQEEAERAEAERKRQEADDEEPESENDNISTIPIPANTPTTDENFAWWSKLFIEEQGMLCYAM